MVVWGWFRGRIGPVSSPLRIQGGPLPAYPPLMPTYRALTDLVIVRVAPELKADWHSLAVLSHARDFYRGDGPGACGRMLARFVRAETERVRADLLRMGKDPDLILSRAGRTRDEPEPDYGRASQVLSDPD